MDQLEILQRELDKVLEQVGKVLAANDSKTTLAAGTKLKHVLPGAQVNFHDALDHLSEEIEFARLVMRRDLAIAQGPIKPEPETARAPTPIAAPVETEPEPPQAKTPTPPPAPADVPDEKPSAPTETDQPDEKPSEVQPSNDNSITTAEDPQPPTSNSNDLSTDNDNISALLPGLQDYANTQPDSGDNGGTAANDEINFDDIFGTGDGGMNDFDEQQGVIGGGGDGGLGDFMDFDFEAEFGAASGGGGDGTAGNGVFGNGDEDIFKFD